MGGQLSRCCWFWRLQDEAVDIATATWILRGFVAEQTLPSPPVFNGIAVARDRLFLAAENGALAGYGKP